jgi:hypothetical protein
MLYEAYSNHDCLRETFDAALQEQQNIVLQAGSLSRALPNQSVKDCRKNRDSLNAVSSMMPRAVNSTKRSAVSPSII